MKKVILVFLFILFVGSGLYFVSGVILEMASERSIDYILRHITHSEVEYTRPSYRSVNLSSFNAVTWKEVSFDLRRARSETDKAGEVLLLKIGALTMSLDSLAERAVLLSAKGLSASTKAKGAVGQPGVSGAGGHFEKGELKIRLTLESFSEAVVTRQGRDLMAELHRFAAGGATTLPLAFTATNLFEIKGSPYRARLLVEQKNGEYRLVMDRDDVRIIAATMSGGKSTSADIEVISRNPVRAPELLRIRDKAASTAKLARQQDPNIPEDAYRHVLWSYLLTKAYGEGFAKEVTDAHEMLADQEKLSKEEILKRHIDSYQDLYNNAAGRRYAAMGYPEARILRYVLTADDIIRDENKVARFNASDYERLKPEPAKPL